MGLARRTPGVRPAAAAALAALVLGWGLAWVGGLPFEQDLFDVCNSRLTEIDRYEIDPVLFPPGATECVVTAPDGAQSEHLYIPWVEWLTVVLVAAGAGLGVAALTRRHRPALMAYGWLIFTVAGLAAWFASPLTALAFLGVAIGLAAGVVAVRIRPPPTKGSSP